jgi:hypothetical protein
MTARLHVSLVRVLLVSALALGSTWFAYRSVRAELGQRALDWSKLVLDLPASWVSVSPRTVVLNGARVRITTGHSELSLGALLDRLQASCRARSSIQDEQLAIGVVGTLSGLLSGVLRIERERDGVVACLALGDEPLDYKGVLARLRRFGQTTDLASVGAVHMARVEARDDGSFFVVASSEGALPLDQLFPSAGDAPGLDVPNLGRPQAARRILSVWQENGEPMLSIYESARPLGTSFDGYVARIERMGAELLAASPMSEQSRAALFMHGGHSYLIAGTRRAGLSLIAVSASDRGVGDSALRMPATSLRPAR